MRSGTKSIRGVQRIKAKACARHRKERREALESGRDFWEEDSEERGGPFPRERAAPLYICVSYERLMVSASHQHRGLKDVFVP